MAGYFPPPGVQQPQKYPFVGPSYMRFGEQKGWIYNPYTDKYTPDPNTIKQMQIQQGIREPDPEKPSLADQLIPVAAVGGTLIASQSLGKEIPGLLKDAGAGIKDSITGLFGGGGITEATAPTQGFIGPPTPPGLGVEGAATGFFDLSSGGLLAEGAMPVGNYIPGILGAYGAYDLFDNEYGAGRGALQGAASGAGIGFTVGGPVGAGIGAGVGALVGLGKSFFNHESTREVAQRHTSELAEMGQDNAAWQNYVAGIRAQHNEEPPDPDKPYHGGQYSSFSEYKAAGLDPTDLTGVYGNLKTYGPSWANLTEEQRVAITQANIADDLYDSKKGEVIITDSAKAKANYDRIINGGTASTQESNQPTGMFGGGSQTPPPAQQTAQPVPKLTPQQVAQTGQVTPASPSGMLPPPQQSAQIVPMQDGSGRYINLATGQIVQQPMAA